MLSKCANPECSEIFKYLHQGKIFRLAPNPEIELIVEAIPSLHERFWLCDKCCKKLKIVWDGTEMQLVPLASETKAVGARPLIPVPDTPDSESAPRRIHPRARTASAGRNDR